MESNAPWLSSYGDVSFHLSYPEDSISTVVLNTAQRPENRNFPALQFMGRKITYSELADAVEKVARSFAAIGVKEGTRVTVCLPNVPQAVYCLYALNRIGAVASMIHPLSAVEEIVFYLNETQSEYAITLDQFYEKFTEVCKKVPLRTLLITEAADELSFPLNVISHAQNSRKYPQPDPTDSHQMKWKAFLKKGASFSGEYICEKKADDVAVLLFSGGTTGKTKGIELTNLNFNALAYQTAEMAHKPVCHTRMLAAMPIFHGFGLGVCIHTMLAVGGTSILVPRFNVKEYANLIRTTKPNYIAGVPTLFEAITRNPYLDGVNLSFLYGVFSGGDSLPVELKKRFDAFLTSHGATIHIREGYGTTECVTASCLTPYHKEKEGSIGLPYPDTYYKICRPDSTEEVPFGTEGEICLSGPSVMKGYLNNAEETEHTLRRHEDGRIWLHTGDLGTMDDEGFIYFRQRIKRMIVTSGYNVYPSQIENILDAHEAVRMSCVIGVRDPYKMQKVKAFVVLKDGYTPSDTLKEDLFEHCRRHIAKYALPYDIEFRDSLPQTLVGKIAYTTLEKEEAKK